MDKGEIFNNVISEKFLDHLNQREGILQKKGQELDVIENSMKNFQCNNTLLLF